MLVLITGSWPRREHRRGAVAGIMQAKAIVVYSLLKPVDLTPRYAQLNFVNAWSPSGGRTWKRWKEAKSGFSR